MKSHPSFSAFLEVSMHKPLLLQARISRLVRECEIGNSGETLNGLANFHSYSPEFIIEGNLFLGNSGLQLRIPYKTSFVFTWIKSNRKSKLVWSMSLS
ncbi:MAG: hypothetical protein ABIW38_09345 [Ferruginibacter sp.]